MVDYIILLIFINICSFNKKFNILKVQITFCLCTFNKIWIGISYFVFHCFRKGGLLLNNVLGISGACLMWCTKIANSYEMLFFGRFIIGVNCGEYFSFPFGIIQHNLLNSIRWNIGSDADFFVLVPTTGLIFVDDTYFLLYVFYW